MTGVDDRCDYPPVDNICGYPVHPAAALFPLIVGAEFEALVEDIRANGQMEPIVLSADGVLIDGRNRGLACQRLGLTPRVRVHDGADVVQFVISHNLHRRHLTESQRAMIAASLSARPMGRPKKVGDITDFRPLTAPEAAELMSVGVSSITKAKRVQSAGVPALQALVTEGLAPVNTAARVAEELPPAEQHKYVETVRAGADPVKAAPPARSAPKPVDRPAAPSQYGPRRKHLTQVDALVTALSGVLVAFVGVDTLDDSITSEEATRLTGDLSRQIRALTRINNLIKERTS
jgi:hypothetical protein